MSRRRKPRQRKPLRAVMAVAVVIVLAAVAVALLRHKPAAQAVPPPPGTLPHTPETYLGVYAANVPMSYTGVTQFTTDTGVKPDVVLYYSGWYERFRTPFATAAAAHGAVPLVQMEPRNVSLAAIAEGKYDAYLSQFAVHVKAYGHPVIMSFGHEMNGFWYPWANRHTSPATFVAAWRHIVTLFRDLGARNVTWLWTANIIDNRNNRIPSPRPWWPGGSYVNWVGIDGYYQKPSFAFAPLFGPTIANVRTFTHKPILIAETGVATVAGQPAKIADLFKGVHAYGLLGFIWFDSTSVENFQIKSPAAAAAFRAGARTYKFPAS
ncbi:MAG TPA: glycosyl hydrolase [Streptosporangiaceae bacterium]|nr:glycosyl hydrolase [Streptosporangiaceae bacterium]